LFLHQENRNELKNRRSRCFKSKQISSPQQNQQKIYSLIKKYLAKTAQKRMNFDKTSPKIRNPQQQINSRNATKKTTQLWEKTAQLAILLQ